MPKLTLTPIETICGRHGEVFRPNWPTGYPAFAAVGFQALMADDAFAEAVAGATADPALPDVTTHEAAIMHLLSRRPLCCTLGPDGLLAVYNEVNARDRVWAARHCALCGRHRAGGRYRRTWPYPLMPGAGGLPRWEHVCLRCVTHGQDGR